MEVGMSIADRPEFANDIWLMQKEELDAYFDDILRDDEEAADSLARVLVRIWDAMEESPSGLMRAKNTMKDAIELLYLRTDVHHAAFNLYILSLQGQLKPEDEPLALINSAMTRRTPKTHEDEQPPVTTSS